MWDTRRCLKQNNIMDANERGEVRDMIHGILSGWEAATIARDDLINVNLEGIKEHLSRLNGSVAKHEEKINGNLPHTIANCAQKETIEELKLAITGDKAIKREKDREKAHKHSDIVRWIMIIGIAVSIYFGWKSNNKTDIVEKRIENLGVPIVTRNGELMVLPDSTGIQFFPNDTVRYMIIKDKGVRP